MARSTVFRITWYPATCTLSVEASHDRATAEVDTMVPVIPVGMLGGVVSGGARVVADTEGDGIDSFPAASLAVTV